MTTQHPEGRRLQLERASQEWRSALIDVSGTNRLLFFKPTAATLDLSDVPPKAMVQLLAGDPVRLTQLFPAELFPAENRLDVAKRACKALAAKQREATEEYGVSIAFLALGLATWRGDSDSSAPSAPVLLRALTLFARPGADNWELTLADEAQLNPVLSHVLSFHGVRLDEQETLEAGDDNHGELAPIYDHVRKACTELVGFRIDERSLLGAFSYLKQPMVADCEDITALATSDLVAALAGDPDAIAAIRTQVGDVGEADPDYLPVEAEHLVLDADASQSFVVNAALAGRNLVVQGPPGTGKSQTIANVIAALVADGKRVLFVAQKRAAITAVLDRLTEVGLDDLTLDLFAAGSSRRYVADRLRDVLDRQAEVGKPVTSALHRRLQMALDTLVSHRDAMHTGRQLGGFTVAELLDLAYGLPPNVTDLRLPSSTLSAWRPDDLDKHAEALEELANKGGLRADLLTESGWSIADLITNDAVAAANQALLGVRAELPAATEAVRELAADLGVVDWTGPERLDALLLVATQAAALQNIPAALDTAIIDDAALQRMLSATDRRYRRVNGPKLGWFARRSIRKQARALVIAAKAPDHAALHQLLLRAEELRRTWVALGAAGGPRSSPALPAAQQTFSALSQGLNELSGYVQNLDLLAVGLTQLPEVLRRLAADQRRARIPRLHDLEQQLTSAGLGRFLEDLRRGPDPGDSIASTTALRYAVVHSALEHALSTDPALAGITGADLTQASDNFRSSDREHLKANAARVRRAAAVRLKAVLDEYPDQHLTVQRELTRKRNFRSVRRLFDEASQVMTAIKPCWAMSPLQVSRLLPAAACFDVVIFDEASQVKPADAIPALLRAPQVVVAGDSRQLPPTEFFSKVLEDRADPVPSGAGHREQDALAAEAAEEDAELAAGSGSGSPTPAPWAATESFTRDAESILFAVDRVLAGQSRRLLWHYRSRDERLIATSNAFIYGSSLTTFPAADGADCLRHEVVPASPGIRGGTNSPEGEVRHVVQRVLDHARSRPNETLGVITFGIAHARRVEAALDAAFAAEPELEAVLNANQREPFFVKNIERVQGDERDAVILSVGYGKSSDGRLKLFWGPLLQPGGERRLNVAISRARSRMTLVTSFAADDLPETGHGSDGYRLMYRFLRFVATGELTADGATAGALKPFEQEVHDRLIDLGMDLVPQVGVGSYRLDFAVRHPDQSGRFLLAIETDGANYDSGRIARERDRLRQRLLELRGWTFHRIWSTEWFNDYESQLTAVQSAYQRALVGRRGSRIVAGLSSAQDAAE